MEAGDVGLVIDALSGVPLVALGIFVASVRPRRAVNVLFAGFAVTYGLRDMLDNGIELMGLPEEWRGPVSLLGYAGAACLAGAVMWFPRALAREELPLVATSAAAAMLFSTFSLHLYASGLIALNALNVQVSVRIAVYFFAAVLAALRFARSPAHAPARERVSLALVAAALLPYPLILTGTGFITSWKLGAPAWAFALLVPMGAFIALWLRESARRPRPDSRAARNVVLVTCAAILAGMALEAAASVDPDFGHAGMSRLLGAGIFAYAILRHQLFDIDVKVKWTLKQSTVAGAFIAVVFVASEAASAFFADRTGTYVGIAAAGVLVFALAPLQRVAERLADRAMPNVHERDAAYLVDRKRAAYRDALRIAWQDGALSPTEYRHLMDLRDILGLPREDYERMEREREGELLA